MPESVQTGFHFGLDFRGNLVAVRRVARFYQRGTISVMREWTSPPIASPWRQGLCGSITAVVVLTILVVPGFGGHTPDTPDDTVMPEVRNDGLQAEVRTPSPPSHIPAFSVARPEPPVADKKPAADTPVSPSSFRMADGAAFPVVINIPAGPSWRDVFRTYGGAIGVSNSSSPRPAYLNHTITPDGRLDEESVPTIGRFLFRLSDEAIRVVNATVDPAARIPAGQAAFGVFAGPFRSVVARVLQDFCATEHVNPDDLTAVQLELGPGFGLRVASSTRR